MKQISSSLFFFLLCLGFGTLAAQEATVIDNKGTLHTVTSNTVTTTAVSPTTPVDGDVWFDTTSNTTKIYEAATATWKTIDPDSVTVSATTPTLPIEGDVWFDTASNTTKIYSGSAWHAVQANSALSLWDADQDTGIQVEETGDEDKIRFDTGGSERMLIDASGNVGIGTDLTSRTFTVSGTARITGLSVDTTATTSIVIVDETGELKSGERFWFNGGAVRSSLSTTNLLTSGMTATQSSDFNSGTTADLAINGNTSSSERTLTASQVYPWWKLDMGSNVTLNRLKLFQHSGAQVRLSNFYVVFSENNISLPATPTTTDLNNLINACGNTAVHYSGRIPVPSGDVNFEELTARYMIIVRDLSTAEHLQIAEVQAFKDDLAYNSITTPKGKVGIGTTLPGRTLTVSGTAQITGLSVDTTATTSLVVIDSSGELKSGERFWFKGELSRTTTTTNILSSTMTATQSSDYGSDTANNAINGNTTSSDRSLTQNQVYPWWKLDMGSNLTLNRLKLFQYGSSQFRLSNFYVVFSQSDINLPPTPTAADVSNLIGGSGNTAVRYSGQIPNPSGDVTFQELTARYMIIVRDISTADYLQIGEVQAFKDDITPTTAIRTLSDKVGIGTSAPSETLTVSGTAQITGLPAATGTVSLVVANANGVLQRAALGSISGTDSQTLAFGQATPTATETTITLDNSQSLSLTASGSLSFNTTSSSTLELIVDASNLIDADGDTNIQVEESTDDDIIRFDTAGSERMVIASSGNVGIGTSSPVAALQVSSTTSGFLPPRMTITQRDNIASPPIGLLIYNTTFNKLNMYIGRWVQFSQEDENVVHSATGKYWLDRNLGASRIAISSTDAASYGYLYQWGRNSDGHQIRTSSTAAGPVGNGGVEGTNFITVGTVDWLQFRDDTRWNDATKGVHDPCPSGFRVPTETELNNERLQFSTNNSAGAFASVLKLPAAGFRKNDGTIDGVGVNGDIWSSTHAGANNAVRLYFNATNAGTGGIYRSFGMTVRCIQE